MDELDDRRELVMMYATVTEGAGGEDKERRPQALAATAYYVFGHLADQRDVGTEARANDAIHGLHVGGDELADGVDRHAAA